MLYDVWVQVPSTAPNQYNPNQIFQIGNGFGFFLIFLSQRYNPLDLASMVSVQGTEVPWDPCEIMIQQNRYFLHIGIFFYGGIWYTELNKSEFIKEDMDETVFMFALFKCRKFDKRRN